MAIAVDMDEVLFPSLRYFCDFLSRNYGYEIRPSDFHAYNFGYVHGSEGRVEDRDKNKPSVSMAMWEKFNQTPF